MGEQESNALIGQLAADQVLNNALLIALTECIPDLQPRVAAKVLVAAHVARGQLASGQLQSFDQRLAELRGLLEP